MKRLVLLHLYFLAPLSAQEKAAISVTSYTYKRVSDLEIKLDVHQRKTDNGRKPLAVWIHGGALINGGREGVGGARELLDHGFCVASIDYRLAPETRLPEIVEDVEDAIRWLRDNGEEKFGADTSKIAVIGGSAGGYLTLSAGFRVEPPPTVLVAFWGYGDIVTPWLAEPSPHPAHYRRGPLSPKEMKELESGPAIANAKDRKGDGGAYYSTTRQQGTWPEKVSGFRETEVKKFLPFMPSRNISDKYPPTLLIHGTEDTDVPHEQSEIMAAQFTKHGVPFEFISVEGGEHGLRGADSDDIAAARERVVPFVLKWMK